MDSDLLKILSEELRETRSMVVETRRMADAAQQTAVAAQKSAEAAQKSAGAAWEQVIMTRNRIEEELRLLREPWWKKLVGRTA